MCVQYLRFYFGDCYHACVFCRTTGGQYKEADRRWSTTCAVDGWLRGLVLGIAGVF